jgi:hypothetical protein
VLATPIGPSALAISALGACPRCGLTLSMAKTLYPPKPEIATPGESP